MTADLRPVPAAALTLDPSLLPSNAEAEAGLLGAMMIDNNNIARFHWLPAEAFFEPVHGRIYTAICQEVAESGTANPVTLKPRMAEDLALKELGGPGYLAVLTGSSAALIGASAFAQQIFELYRRRELAKALHENLLACIDTSEGTACDALTEQIDEAVNATALQAPIQSRNIAKLDRAWDEAIEHHDAVARGEIESAMKIEGLDDLNDLLAGGLRAGNLIVIAGRPGMGKTALAVTLASSCARAGLVTRFNSLEMTNHDLTQRQIADICYDRDLPQCFTYQQLKDGKVSLSEMSRIKNAREECESWPLTYDDTAQLKVGHLIGKLRRQKRESEKQGRPLQIAIIDYLQLLSSDHDYKGNKNLEVSEITRALKIAAKELGLAIILLSQLSRNVEMRESKRPMLSDLRDSGSIEQDADVVLFLYRAEYYLKDAEPEKTSDSKSIGKHEAWRLEMAASRDRMDLIAAKVRGGPTGYRKCWFFGAHQAVRGSKFMTEGGW